MSFDEIWNRIRGETPIKNFSGLAKLVGTSQPNVSKRKKENFFPADWAYMVAKKYGLLTEWIMTGEGPKGLEDVTKNEEQAFQGNFAEWIKEESAKDPNFYANFTAECAVLFPRFADWLKKRKTSLAQGNNSRKNVA